jgi:glycine dehydrogenase subunit 1
MKYLPLTDNQIKKILKELGIDNEDGLFSSIPKELQTNPGKKLPNPLSEISLRKKFTQYKYKNWVDGNTRNFCGGGSYNHYIPSIIDPLVSRSEFLTAYTSYQPEVSQGTLQSIFEYQTMICQLTGMDISNASLYDGATASVEGILMSVRVSRKTNIIISSNTNPQYKETIETYAKSEAFNIFYYSITDVVTGKIEINESALEKQWGIWQKTGRVSSDETKEQFLKNTAAFVVQSPNYFGIIEDYTKVRDLLGNHIILIHVISDFISIGILKSPGSQGADIVAGEGQSLGIPLCFGGPHLGVLSAKKKFMRQMPGRFVGMTHDSDGEEGYVITLATREQHIRREKATSNICTNQTLMAIRAVIYLAVMGPDGIREAAEQSHNNILYIIQAIQDNKSVDMVFNAPVFNECLIEFKTENERDSFIAEGLKIEPDNLVPGIPIESNKLLVACTEMLEKQDLDDFIELLFKCTK